MAEFGLTHAASRDHREQVIFQQIGGRKTNTSGIQRLEHFEGIEFIGNGDHREQQFVHNRVNKTRNRFTVTVGMRHDALLKP